MPQNPNVLPYLGKFPTVAALTAQHPPASLANPAMAITGDLGLVYANGTAWVAAVSTSAGAVPSAGTFATLVALRAAQPAATSPVGLYAFTTDRGPAANTGIGWLPTSPEYNVLAFGAIGDGTTHPLSSVYGTLTAAQVAYPSALALTEEIDYNAFRRAKEVATANGRGGTIVVPAGVFMMNNASNQGNFQLPACALTGGTGTQINIRGAGAMATQLKWPSDYGTTGSLFAMSCGDQASSFATPGTGRYANGQTFFGFLEGFSMIGPNLTIVKGTVNANLAGLAWGARRFMRDVHIMGFYANISIVGDWTSFENCVFENAFYPMYFPQRSASLYGDLIFTKCSWGNAARADIGIATLGYMGAKFDGCFIGSAPYAFLNEVTPGQTPDSSTHVTSTQFEKCLFENLGNSFIGDDNGSVAAGGTGVRNFRWQQVDFNSCYWSWNSGQRDTTQSRNGDYAIVAASLKTVRNSGFTNFVPGDVGMFQIDALLGWEEYSDLTGLFSALQGGKLFADASVGVNGVTTFRWRDAPTSDRGSIWRTSATVTQYDVMETNNTNRAVQSTNSTLPVIGTAKHSTAVANAYLMVCHGGHRPIVNAQETPPSANTWIKKGSTAGKAMAATGPADGQVLGYSTGVDTVNNRYNFEWSSGAVVAD